MSHDHGTCEACDKRLFFSEDRICRACRIKLTGKGEA